MTAPPQLLVSIPRASSDGLFHGRYPQGNWPGANPLGTATATVASAVSAALSTGIKLGSAASVTSTGSASLTTSGGGGGTSGFTPASGYTISAPSGFVDGASITITGPTGAFGAKPGGAAPAYLWRPGKGYTTTNDPLSRATFTDANFPETGQSGPSGTPGLQSTTHAPGSSQAFQTIFPGAAVITGTLTNGSAVITSVTQVSGTNFASVDYAFGGLVVKDLGTGLIPDGVTAASSQSGLGSNQITLTSTYTGTTTTGVTINIAYGPDQIACPRALTSQTQNQIYAFRGMNNFPFRYADFNDQNNKFIRCFQNHSSTATDIYFQSNGSNSAISRYVSDGTSVSSTIETFPSNTWVWTANQWFEHIVMYHGNASVGSADGGVTYVADGVVQIGSLGSTPNQGVDYWGTGSSNVGIWEWDDIACRPGSPLANDTAYTDYTLNEDSACLITIEGSGIMEPQWPTAWSTSGGGDSITFVLNSAWINATQGSLVALNLVVQNAGYTRNTVGQFGTVATQVFSYPSGFNTAAQAHFNPVGGSSGWSGTTMQVADGGGHVAGAFWYQTAQINISAFSTTFTFSLPNITTTITAGNPSIALNNNYTSGEQVLFAGQFGSVTGITQSVQYYVSATGLSSSAFQVSATNGGAVITPGGTGSATPQVLAIVGMTFGVQNSNSTTNPNNSGTFAGADANVAGYGAYTSNPAGTRVGNSVAIKFDTSANSSSEATYPQGGVPTAIGLYVNGGPYEALIPQEDLNPFGILLGAGNLLSCTVSYDGTYLTAVLEDTVTGHQCRRAWPINIAACIGGTAAWAGFTAGELFPAPIQVYSWSLYQGINTTLAAPTFSPAPGSYTSTQSVTISGPSGASIYYTTNGLPPTSASTLYTGAISVSTSTILQAVAIESGFTDSYVALSNYQIASGGTPLINFPSGFSSINGLITLAGSTTLIGSAIRLTDQYGYALSGNGNEVGVAWYNAPVSVATFNTTFTYKFTSSAGTNGLGMTFCIQNYSQASTGGNTASWMSGGPFSMGNQSGFGYSGSTGGFGQNAGFNSSVALALDVGSNEIGLFTNGANPNPAGTSLTGGINLSNGHPVTVALTYNGTTLSVLLTDTVNSDTYSTSYTVNIPSIVGANTAYVGFTAGEEFANSIQDVQSWTFQ